MASPAYPTVMERIKENFESLSASQKKVAHYLQKNVREAVLQSASKIASESGVSEATVHRLAHALSYDGFSDMHHDLQQYVLKDQRAVRNFIDTTSKHEDSWLEKHFMQEIDNLRETMEGCNKALIHQAAITILQADRIWIAGWRMGLSITAFLQFVLKYMLGNCEMIPQGGVAEYATYVKADDVLLACGFPRYCSRTLKLATLAKEQGTKVIVFTDSELSPFAKLADVSLLAASKSKGFLDSYTASLSVVNAIINEIAYVEKERVKAHIEKTEMMFGKFQDHFEWH